MSSNLSDKTQLSVIDDHESKPQPLLWPSSEIGKLDDGGGGGGEEEGKKYKDEEKEAEGEDGEEKDLEGEKE